MANYRAGLTASAIYNVNRDTKKHPEPIDPMSFFKTSEPLRIATPEELERALDIGLARAEAAFKRGGVPSRA